MIGSQVLALWKWIPLITSLIHYNLYKQIPAILIAKFQLYFMAEVFHIFTDMPFSSVLRDLTDGNPPLVKVMSRCQSNYKPSPEPITATIRLIFYNKKKERNGWSFTATFKHFLSGFRPDTSYVFPFLSLTVLPFLPFWLSTHVNRCAYVE